MQNEIAKAYNLPQHWEETDDISFTRLSDLVMQIHDATQTAAIKAVNRFATVRNYVIGYYIVEYEQHGSDRAKYGDRLLKRLVENINKNGINETLLKNSRRFYLNYPQIRDYLTGQKSATPSDFSAEKSPMSSDFVHVRARKWLNTHWLVWIISFLFLLICCLCLMRKLWRNSC